MQVAWIQPDQPRRRGGFTLAELLVVMAIMGAVAVLTLVAARRMSEDVKLALGTNAVVAALNEARTLAMKNHRDVLVAFRAQLSDDGTQIVQIVVAQWTGDSYLNGSQGDDAVDRFLPVPGVTIRTLPEGISVASPNYHRIATDLDDVWRPITYLPWMNDGQGELIGQPPGVMFGADGSRILRNSHTDSARSWIDYDNNKEIRRDQTDWDPESISLDFCREFLQLYEDDETFISLSPFLAIYDLGDAIERKGEDWSCNTCCFSDTPGRALVGPEGYITQLGNRIHFNRFSGVVMR